MIKRIKYYIDNEGAKRSQQYFNTDHGTMYVKYYEDRLMALILRADTEQVVDTFTCPTHHSLKKEIKLKLIKMGALFDEEVRKTTES